MLFWTSQAVQQKEDVLSGLKKELSHELESTRVLSVEWDYLNRPQRIEKMAREQLGMILPTSGGVAKSIDDIPEPIIVNIEGGYNGNVQSIPVAFDSKPAAPKIIYKETIAPSMAEKQSFDRLIENLDSQNGDTP